MDLISDQGLRVDGRRPDELRKVRCRLGLYGHTDGSAYLQQGNTKVIAAVYGPHEPKGSFKSKVLHDAAFINCEFSMAAFSTAERRKRTHGDRRTLDTTLNLHKALSASIKTELYPRSQIDVFIQVLEADGGNLSVSLNAATLALVDAGIPLKEYIVACTASLGNGNVPMLDINHLEESLGGPALTIAMLPVSKQIALMDLSQRFHIDYLEKVLNVAEKGCLEIYKILDNAVQQHVLECATSTKVGN